MNQIQNKIIDFCEGDESQKKAIQSDKNPLLVEAPAGYGKTRTLLLKCLYIISQKNSNDYRRTLIVTYTNNGVSRLKNDLNIYLDKLELSSNEKRFFRGKIHIVNFHSLSKKILSKYGYLIHPNLKDIYKFDFVQTNSLGNPLFNGLENYIKKRQEQEFDHNFNDVYPALIKSCDQKTLPYFGPILLLLKLFGDFKSVRSFYNHYYENIFIDEFQDTNFLVNKIIESINKRKSDRYLFGDSLQTIFEFSGSNPELVEKYCKDFPENYLKLKKSHRLNDESLKYLEIYLRTYYRTGKFNHEVKIDLNVFDSDFEESKFIIDESKKYFKVDKTCAILVGNRTGGVANKLNESVFFNALFEDGNNKDNYFSFNEASLNIFHDFLDKYPHRNNLRFFAKYFKDKYQMKNYPYEKNYIHLLNSFIENYLMKRVYYSERNDFLEEVFKKNDLIKFVDCVTDKIVLITVHKSKGLEWDNLFIINMNKGVLNYDASTVSKNLENLRLFYVAITRSRGKVFFSLNNGDNKEPSSFFDLPFLDITKK